MGFFCILWRPEHGRCSRDSDSPMKITVNGEPKHLADHSTVVTLLEELDLAGKFVAVEVNLELVPKARHGDHVLAEGDRVEVVTLVGGG